MAKILIVDDYEDNLYVASLVLSWDNHEIITALSGEEAIKKAESEQPDVILLDIQMPNMDGFAACQILKSNPATQKIPVVFLTAKYKDSESLAKGLSMGAEDYIVKPFSNPELRARVKVMARLKSQMDQLNLKNQELEKLNSELEDKNLQLTKAKHALEELAITDGLTGLHNRRYFTERIKEEFHRTLRKHFPISVILLDIDYFKKVNDTYGHKAGDDVLIHFGQILKRNMRKHDVVARYGGEEFIIGMIDLNGEAAYTIAERIRQDIATDDFLSEGKVLKITSSLGVGCYPEICADSKDPDPLLKEVDKALYYAKNHGRNQSILAPITTKETKDEPKT